MIRPIPPQGWPTHGGEMGQRIRTHDWASSPTGALETWKQSLRTAVDLMLASGFPTVLHLGPGGTILYNDAAIPLLGSGHPAALGRSIGEIWPEARSGWEPVLRRSLAGETVMLANLPHAIWRGGRKVDGWFTFSSYPLRDEDGTVAGVNIVFIDTTDRLAAERRRDEVEARLRDSEERSRIIVETARDYAIFSTDPTGRIETWPPGAEAVFGWSAEEVLGQPVDITFTPADRAKGVPDEERRLAASRGSAADVRWHQRKDGTQVFIDGVTRPITGPDHALRGFVKVGQDVTDRQAMEAALRESEERFRQYGEASSDVLWIRNAETLAFEYISPAFEAVYGLSRTDLLTGNQVRRWAELIHPGDRATALDHLRRVRAGGSLLSTFRIQRPVTGEARWIRDTGFPLLDAGGRVQRVAGIGHDATEEVELNDRLRLLVGELQHRTRNLLAVVSGLSKKTLAGSGSLEDFRARFGARLDALSRVNSLLSRLEDGHRIAFDELLGAELSAHGVTDTKTRSSHVTLKGPPGILLRSSSVQTFALALHELTTNALKHGALSQPGGWLEVRWRLLDHGRHEKRLEVVWRETGIAVRADNDDHPPRRGYGRHLIEQALPYQLGAETDYKLSSEGVRCIITVPLSSTMAGTSGEVDEPDG
ncbi:PAS domain S-box protein [Rubellimicrobium rubrum]|uniref:histidine kinase n=1 Tax=Rubellimicrobium rubrum TaxID=2585369 RepID=A0A5C4MXW5_9RHOB|nr:PAS domain S-box protein [Rubellimicrobium rubrum]TNC49587.1 PAS domain S-box protein [Rubellimicrobium rubrum]